MSKYKMVPVEPTDDMVDAGRSQSSFPLGVYKAMLAAAPEAEHEPVAWARMKGGKIISVFHDKGVAEFLSGFAASELESLYLHPQPWPDVQGEPVAWSGWGCQHPGKMPMLYGERRIAELNCDWENGDQLLHFTASPQPAEQQDNVPDGWRSRFLKLMGEIQSELDDSSDDPIPLELWSLWRELLDTAPQPAEQQPATDLEDLLSSKKDFYDDAIDDIAFSLAFECEEAELDPGDKVTINREKLKAIAARVLENAEAKIAQQQAAPDVPGLVDALEGIMRVEARDRVMPVGAEWDAARAALAAYRKQGGGK